MEFSLKTTVRLGEYEARNLEQLNVAMTSIKSEKDYDIRASEVSAAYSSVDVRLQEDDDLDSVYSEWSNHVNMTASELESWSGNPCSREASLDPEAVIKRNLRLLEKNKEDWTDEDIKDAKRTISFISRMRPNKPDEPRDGAHGCPSDWAISLLNWAYNPFESLPDQPDNDDLDDVEKIEMQERKNIKEAEMLAEPVWKLKDDFSTFADVMEEKAMQLEETRSRSEVQGIRDELLDSISLMRERIDEPISKIEGFETEMQDFEYSENDKVEWDSSGGVAMGLVRDRTAKDCYDASIDGDVKVCGEEDDPAYLIEVYDDEEGELTGTMVSHKQSALRSASFELGAESKLMNPNYEFEPVPTQVLYDEEERAMQRAMNIGLDGVHTHQFGGGQTMYMPGDTHSDWMDFVRGKKGVRVDEEDNPVTRGAQQVFNSQDVLKSEDGEGSDFVRTEPSTIHKISDDDE